MDDITGYVYEWTKPFDADADGYAAIQVWAKDLGPPHKMVRVKIVREEDEDE